MALLVLVLVALGVYLTFPFWDGWRPGKQEYSRGLRQEYSAGVWDTEKKLMTLIESEEKWHIVNFGEMNPLPVVISYKKWVGINWVKEIGPKQKDQWAKAVCSEDGVIIVGKGGLDNFDKIINFGGGVCVRKK